MISLNDQITAVSHAWTPFVLALLAVGAVVWRVFEWFYSARIEKMKSLFEMSRSQIELATQKSARIEDELNETLKKQTVEIERLKEQIGSKPEFKPDSLRSLFAELSETISTAMVQAGELRQANNAVSEAARRNTPWLETH